MAAGQAGETHETSDVGAAIRLTREAMQHGRGLSTSQCVSSTLEIHSMPSELKPVVRLTSFAEEEQTRPALRYWLSRPPAERIAAVEYLRRQIDGSRARLRRVYRVLDCPWR
jgi:hypothetical protein